MPVFARAAPQGGPVEAVIVKPLTPALWPRMEDLFGRSGASNGCWCMYWRLGPGYKSTGREANKAALESLTAAGPPPGLLALQGDLAVGWCQVGPRAALPWLERRLGRRVDESPVWSLSCFYVRRTYRRRGVTDALIAAAVALAKESGAHALEAYPIDTAVPGHSSNLFTGTASAFRRAGFEAAGWRSPSRPIMRRDLGRPHAPGGPTS